MFSREEREVAVARPLAESSLHRADEIACIVVCVYRQQTLIDGVTEGAGFVLLGGAYFAVIVMRRPCRESSSRGRAEHHDRLYGGVISVDAVGGFGREEVAS